MTRHKTSNNNPNNTNHQTNNNNQSTIIYDIKSNNKQQDNECLKMKKKTKLDKLSADCSTKTTTSKQQNTSFDSSTKMVNNNDNKPPDDNSTTSKTIILNNHHHVHNHHHQTQNSQINNNNNNDQLSTRRTWSNMIETMISSSTTILSRARHYLRSPRPSTFFTSLIPVLMGTVLAHKTSGGHQFSWVILLATLITVLSIHAAGNLVNTYCDFMHGIDSKRQSDDRTLVDSILTPEEVANLGVLFYFIGFIGFVVVVVQSPARMELLAFIYFGGLSSSFLYTGGIGLKYIALGDIIIMITFGPVSVLYSFIAQTGSIRLVTLLYAIPLALNAEAILHSNNTRDIDVDRRAGCVTIAMLIGYQASHVLFSLLLFVPYILFVVVSINYSLWLLLPLITLPKAFHLEKQFRFKHLQHIPQQMAILNFYFGMFYLFACFMAPAHKLPGLLR